MSTGWILSGRTVQQRGLTTNGHELARMFSRAQHALECDGLTPLSFPRRSPGTHYER
jgi:hypothetical protein